MRNEAVTTGPARNASTRRARSTPGSDLLMKVTVRYDDVKISRLRVWFDAEVRGTRRSGIGSDRKQMTKRGGGRGGAAEWVWRRKCGINGGGVRVDKWTSGAAVVHGRTKTCGGGGRLYEWLDARPICSHGHADWLISSAHFWSVQHLPPFFTPSANRHRWAACLHQRRV